MCVCEREGRSNDGSIDRERITFCVHVCPFIAVEIPNVMSYKGCHHFFGRNFEPNTPGEEQQELPDGISESASVFVASSILEVGDFSLSGICLANVIFKK